MRTLEEIAIKCFLLFLVTACATGSKEGDRIVPFSRARPLNYLVMHDHSDPTVVQDAKCYELTAEDSNSSKNIALLLRGLFRERLRALPLCRGGESLRVTIDYHAGYGVNVHGINPSNPQRSGYVFFSVYNAADERIGGGEWGYFRGGSAELMAEQFVFDFTNLYINGLEKPPR